MSNRKSETRRTVFRDSVDGQFVTQRYAESHPNTTERERVRIPTNK